MDEARALADRVRLEEWLRVARQLEGEHLVLDHEQQVARLLLGRQVLLGVTRIESRRGARASKAGEHGGVGRAGHGVWGVGETWLKAFGGTSIASTLWMWMLTSSRPLILSGLLVSSTNWAALEKTPRRGASVARQQHVPG